MRTLLVMRGIPGSGKSTWIRENGLESFTLCADTIRLLYQSPAMDVAGNNTITNWEEAKVWDTLFQMLESRMSHGEFVVVDATSTTQKELSRYKTFADQHRYRMYVIDFSSVPLEVAKERNQGRELLKRVPDWVIDKMYTRLNDNLTVSKGITVLNPDDLEQVYLKPIDLSSYKTIHHIGDIHGCYTVLMEYLDGGIKEDEFYIFLGDYIDRGIENAKVLSYLLSIMNYPNVLLLEGNHEKWLNMWANDEKAMSKEFESNTKKALEQYGIKKKEVRKFYRKLAQCAYYAYNGKTYVVTHGGISAIPRNLVFTATKQLIEGVGHYEDVTLVEENFSNNLPAHYNQVHGHRNNDAAIDSNERNYNLEGSVEFGGHLRCLQVSRESILPVYTKNNVTKDKHTFSTVNELVDSLQNDSYIKEKKYGNISSFNFTRDAFFNKKWNARTVKARGLFIDTKRMKICARGYEKFFNRNETISTSLETLKEKLGFPVSAYVKENGFLGIVGYDYDKDDLFVTSKSDPTGIYSSWFKTLLESKMAAENRLKMLDYIKENNCSFVFECVDQEHDAHIIAYQDSDVYLLDIIYNEIEFHKADYSLLKEVADQLNIKCKELAITLESWEQFIDWIDMIEQPGYQYLEKEVEGFVIEDSKGFLLKEKLHFYSYWKRMRTLVDRVFAEKSIVKEDLDTVQQEFLDFVRSKKEEGTLTSKNICYLRNMYHKSILKY